jgi:cold shock CspA family protein
MDIQIKNNRGQLLKMLKNYGFIRFEGRDVFVHRDAYLQGFKPEIWQIVSFDFALAPEPDRPPVAVNVRVIKPASAFQAEKRIENALKTPRVRAVSSERKHPNRV